MRTMEYIKQNYKGFLISGSIVLFNAAFCFGIFWDTRVYFANHDSSVYNLFLIVPYGIGFLLSVVSLAVGVPLLLVGMTRRKKFLRLTNHIIEEQ